MEEKIEFSSLEELKEYLTVNNKFCFTVYYFQKCLCDATLTDKNTVKDILLNNLPFLDKNFDEKRYINSFFITSMEMLYIINNWNSLLEEQKERDKIEEQKINFLYRHGKRFKRRKSLPKYYVIEYFEIKNKHNMFFKSRNENANPKYYTGWELIEKYYYEFIKEFNTNKL